jgi:hypothetical protein
MPNGDIGGKRQREKPTSAFLTTGRALLGDPPQEGGVDSSASAHTLRTAPVLTGDAYRALGSDVIPQCALYGRVITQHAPGFDDTVESPEVLINSNAPFSAVVCGVQVRLS